MIGSNSTTPVRATVLTGTCLLIGASAALGTYFGYQTGAHHHVILGLIFGGAALGGELLKPFAMAGAFEAFKRWDISRGVACLLVGLVCIVYSLASELALSAGSRGDLAATREAQSESLHAAKEKRQRAIDELAGLKPSRPVAELAALVDAARPQCRISMTLARGREMICAKPAGLVAEFARAKRRAELETTIAAAEKAMEAAPAVVKDADPLAAAVAYYMTAAGWKVAAETVSPWLYLLPVLFLELGSALGLVVAGATGVNDKSLDAQTVHRGTVHSSAPPIKEIPAAPIEITPARTVHSPAQSARDRLLQMLRDDKGVLRTGHRALGEALGISATRAGQLLRQLADDGKIRVRAGKTGSVITLAPRVVAAVG